MTKPHSFQNTNHDDDIDTVENKTVILKKFYDGQWRRKQAEGLLNETAGVSEGL